MSFTCSLKTVSILSVLLLGGWLLPWSTLKNFHLTIEAIPPPQDPTPQVNNLSDSQFVSKAPRKKALLIGISRMINQRRLLGPHRDVKAMRSLLIDVYGYRPEDIQILMDTSDAIKPTRKNIIRYIKKLVKGAKDGDRFFFHFSGHTDQEETNDKEEEDGFNELLLTLDGQSITDDELRRLLVDPLPPKCTLTAVLDSCHSCSLLDLPHYRCNRVYVPWLNKGKRTGPTLRENIWRQHAMRLHASSARASKQSKRLRMSNNAHEAKRKDLDWILPNIDRHQDEPVEEHSLNVPNLSTISTNHQEQETGETKNPTIPPVFSRHESSDQWLIPSAKEAIIPDLADLGTSDNVSGGAEARGVERWSSLPVPVTTRTEQPPRRKTQIPLSISVDVAPSIQLAEKAFLTPSQPTPFHPLTQGLLQVPGLERQYSESPIAIYCTGDCRTKSILHDNDQEKALVICLSSTKDDERSWEDQKGRSMTMYLVDLLRENRERSLRELLTLISHKIHEHYLPLHTYSREFKRRVMKERETFLIEGYEDCELTSYYETLEPHNFQNPQISSHRPLDMEMIFSP